MPGFGTYALRLRRGLRYAGILLVAMVRPSRRQLLGEVLALARRLPSELEQPLPDALRELTPAPGERVPDTEAIRLIVDAVTAFGAGKPLGVCLRRSLLRYYFLRRAHLPVTVHLGARRLGESLGGHAWLTLDGQPYHESPENYRGYAIMLSYPPEA